MENRGCQVFHRTGRRRHMPRAVRTSRERLMVGGGEREHASSRCPVGRCRRDGAAADLGELTCSPLPSSTGCWRRSTPATANSTSPRCRSPTRPSEPAGAAPAPRDARGGRPPARRAVTRPVRRVLEITGTAGPLLGGARRRAAVYRVRCRASGVQTRSMADMWAFREAVDRWAAGGPGGPAGELAGRLGLRTAVLLEGPSDLAAVETLARAGPATWPPRGWPSCRWAAP